MCITGTDSDVEWTSCSTITRPSCGCQPWRWFLRRSVNTSHTIGQSSKSTCFVQQQVQSGFFQDWHWGVTTEEGAGKCLEYWRHSRRYCPNKMFSFNFTTQDDKLENSCNSVFQVVIMVSHPSYPKPKSGHLSALETWVFGWLLVFQVNFVSPLQYICKDNKAKCNWHFTHSSSPPISGYILERCNIIMIVGHNFTWVLVHVNCQIVPLGMTSVDLTLAHP